MPEERTMGDVVTEMAEVAKRLKEANERYLKANNGSYRNLFKRMYPDIKPQATIATNLEL